MPLPQDLSEWNDWARRDDWDCFFGPADLRVMLGEISRLRHALKQFVAACDTAPPTSLMVEIGAACKAARPLISD